MKGSKQTSIRCSEHGESKWTGQVICIACKAVWHLTDPAKSPTDPLGRCTCGKILVGGVGIGTARAICPQCFTSRWPSSAPTIPAPPEQTLH